MRSIESKLLIKAFAVVLVITLLTVVLFFIDFGEEEDDGKVQVVATFYPLWFFASEIGGERAEVSCLIPNNVEPHSWSPRPSDLVRTDRADIFIFNGAGFEPWAEDFQAQLKAGVQVVDTSQGVSLLAHEEEEEHEDHEQGLQDPHFWIDPLSAKVQVENILQAFIEADPGNSTYYQANADHLQQRLAALHSAFEEGLANRTRNDIITTHEGFNYLAHRYNFTAHAAIGISGDEQPSVQDLTRLADLIENLDLNYVFGEPVFADQVVEQIARITGAEVLVLDGAHSRSGVNADKDYFGIMYANLEALRIGLEVTG